MYAGAAFLHHRDFLRTPPSILEDLTHCHSNPLGPLRDSATSFLLHDVLVGVLDESCDGDVEDELDNRGTTRGTNFPFCKIFLPLFCEPWFLTAAHY